MKSKLNNVRVKIYFNIGLIGVLLFSLILYGLKTFGYLSHISIPDNFVNWLIISVSIVGIIPVIWSAVVALFKKSITVDLLASIALIFTIIEHEWVSAAFINLMLSSARLFSAFTEEKTENIIKHLLKLRPVKVKIQVGNSAKEVLLDEVSVGDLVIVDSGDRIAVDGKVISGQASVDQSTLTGESEPISKKIGSQVLSSTLCVAGSLLVKAEKVGKDTTLSKMIALVDEASRAKTKTETFANKFSAWYILLTILGSAIIFILTKNLNLVLSILLVTCADDLAVAIPLGFTVAISKAAHHGIVVKGAAVMERLKDIRTFVTDKTGTLTKGIAKVVNFEVLGGVSKELFLSVAATACTNSKHPTSKTILEYVKGINHTEGHTPDEAREFPGEGIWVKHDGHEYLQGKFSFLTDNKVEISKEVEQKVREIQAGGRSISFISIDKKLAGFFILEDEIKKFAKEAILETKTLGIKKWVMLTGDNFEVAERVSNSLGIDEFYSNLKPADKLEMIKKMHHKHGAVAMIGDGVNDAASLALADVSFAMGAIGSDASIEAADIALMHDDLRRIPESILLSKKSISIVKQNFIIWGISNLIGLGLVFGGFLGPIGASVFNFLTDFFPIMNVFKIYGLKINKHTYGISD